MGFVGKPPTGANRSDPATRAAWAALSMPLRECGEIAGQRLSIALSDALGQATDLLFSESTQALTRAEQEAMLDAAEFARTRRECLIGDFRKHFEMRYVRACQYKPKIMSGYRIDFDASQLKVVKHDLLDDSLDPGKIAEAIQNSCWGSLHDLTKCFGKLLAVTGLNPNEIPLSPRLIEAAVSDAALDQPWRHDAKFRLMRSLRRYLPARVGQLYLDLAEHLDPLTRQLSQENSNTSVAASDQVDDALLETPPVLDIEPHRAAIDVAPANEAVELALAVAHDLVARRQVETSSQLDRVEAVCLPDERPALPDPVAQAAPREEIQAMAPVMPTTRDRSVGTAQVAAVLAELEIGAWLEFREADGSLRELKLAWISPRKSLYLMTNRQGARALSMVAEDLAAALRDGRVHIVMPRETSLTACVVPGHCTKKSA